MSPAPSRWCGAPGRRRPIAQVLDAQVLDALPNTARGIEAPGDDTRTGWGLVQAADAIEELNK